MVQILRLTLFNRFGAADHQQVGLEGGKSMGNFNDEANGGYYGTGQTGSAAEELGRSVRANEDYGRKAYDEIMNSPGPTAAEPTYYDPGPSQPQRQGARFPKPARAKKKMGLVGQAVLLGVIGFALYHMLPSSTSGGIDPALIWLGVVLAFLIGLAFLAGKIWDNNNFRAAAVLGGVVLIGYLISKGLI